MSIYVFSIYEKKGFGLDWKMIVSPVSPLSELKISSGSHERIRILGRRIFGTFVRPGEEESANFPSARMIILVSRSWILAKAFNKNRYDARGISCSVYKRVSCMIFLYQQIFIYSCDINTYSLSFDLVIYHRRQLIDLNTIKYKLSGFVLSKYIM